MLGGDREEVCGSRDYINFEASHAKLRSEYRSNVLQCNARKERKVGLGNQA